MISKTETEGNPCLIFGCGRSGTSMLSGMLHSAGYYMGEDLYPPREGNPRGFFEAPLVNRINEQILSKYDEGNSTWWWLKRVLKRKKYTVYRPRYGYRWLFILPVTTDVTAYQQSVFSDVKKLTSKELFAYKDPRFCYTLSVWAGYLPARVVFLCIFRHPAVTVKSILKECSSAQYLSQLLIDEPTAYKVWISMYRYVLEKQRHYFPTIHFIHYNQVLDGSKLPYLENILRHSLNREFADPKLNRTTFQKGAVIPREAQDIYRELCYLADYNPE